MNNTPAELTYEDLRFDFALPGTETPSTPSSVLIGQPRAIRALELGTAIDAPGYNIFVSGPPGTGRETAIRKILNGLPPSETVRDLVYVNNFLRPDNPAILALPQGKAPLFKTRLHEVIESLKVRIRQELAGESYKTQRDQLLKKTEFRETHLVSEFEGKLAQHGFKMTEVEDAEADPGAMDILPVFDGEPITFDELQEKVSSGAITEEQWNQTRERYYRHIDEMRALFDSLREARAVMEKDLAKLQSSAVRPMVRRQVRSVGRAFPYFAVKIWLTTLEKDIEANLFLFLNDKAPEDPSGIPALARYGVNVLVDHGTDPKLPIVFETRPTPAHLFGTVEARPDPSGESRSNFLMIKPGSFHQASGGYLVLRAEDIVNQEEAWPLLKQALESGQVEIQAASGPFGAVTLLKPQPAEVKVKVIIMGNAGVYDYLIQEDPEFGRLFKISAEFDPVMELTPTTVNEYRVFIDNHLAKHRLPTIDDSGRQEVLEYGVRLAGHRRRLTTQFSQIADLLTESAYWAKKAGQKVIDRQAVARALEERRYLFSLPEEKMDEQVHEGQILLSVSGSAVGQVNGLAVLDRGSSSFGRPMRITAVAGPGEDGIVNIEGEAGLSGEIHDKGVLILHGLIRDKFAREFPLSLSASVGFEQSYGGIDGDSASSTEAYAILSAIAGVPLRQDLAVSGSVNQRGEIQPVGGITEKVEGFYYTCKKQGLTGTQGVVIPRSNIQNLVLNQEVQEAVRDGRFHIYPVTTVDAGIFLLSGMEMGKMDEQGRYPHGSLGHRIVKKLERMREAVHPKDD
jgi:lon-related putative ATP-dependent protease